MGADAGTPRTVLFVDDSKLMRRAAERCLADRYRVLLAEQGKDALAMLDRHPEIEAVITDLSMPGMDGQQLLEAIRASSDARRRAMPVMIATGSGSERDLAAVRAAGADGVMTKPFKADALQGRIQQLLDAADDNAPQEAKPSAPAELLPTCIETSVDRLQQRMRQAIALHTRHGLPLSIMQVRVGNIDDVVREHGQKASRSVMRYVQKVLGQILRDEDSCGPCGRDAFTLVLPMTPPEGAQALADRLEDAFGKRAIRLRKQPLDLKIKLVMRDPKLSSEDLECLAAGMDCPAQRDNVIEVTMPRRRPAAGESSDVDRVPASSSAAVSVTG